MNIMPEGDAFRKAVQWIAERRLENPDQRLSSLVETASVHFDLSPKDEAFLLRFVRKKDGKSLE